MGIDLGKPFADEYGHEYFSMPRMFHSYFALSVGKNCRRDTLIALRDTRVILNTQSIIKQGVSDETEVQIY